MTELNTELNFEYEEKEEYSLEEVQGLVESFKILATDTISLKDTELETARAEIEKVTELETSNHNLQIQNLAIKNGISEDMIDLIADDSIEVVQSKIDKLKSIAKEKEVDSSYKPTENRSEDAYTKAESNKDVKGMLSQKISRIFN